MKLCNSAVMLMASLSENAYIETSRFQELYIFCRWKCRMYTDTSLLEFLLWALKDVRFVHLYVLMVVQDHMQGRWFTTVS